MSNETKQTTWTRKRAAMNCRAQGMTVQIEAETDGQTIRDASCSMQIECPRFRMPADFQVGPCILIEE
ncbi:hypothetical protein [Burkholderia ubonensis]|uniref:hypothetical protein n=1 Tax=Burkholderia ubonensis TaxID=101571 RepID=UPI0012F93B17|nr:hypothetical protein [Burkholderia ubonensis]